MVIPLSHLPAELLWEAKQIMDRKVLCKLGSLREFNHPVMVQQGTPHFSPVSILTYLVMHISAYVHKGSPDSPKDIFSSLLSYEFTATVCMGLVCGCSYTWLLGACSYGCVLSHSLCPLIFMYIYTLMWVHILMCASSPLGLFLSPGQLTISQSLSRISLAGYRVKVWW